MAFDQETTDYLLDILKPKRRRFDFEATMERWAQLVGGSELEKLISASTANTERHGGRPRIDMERRAAVLLAVIYYEYTKRRPTRVTRANQKTNSNKYRTSHFYSFAIGAFRAIGLPERENAFREAVERWGRPRGYSKRELRKELWRKLPPLGTLKRK